MAADQVGPLQSLNGSAANDRVIRFLFHPTPRPDQPSGFLAGFEQRLTKRLQYVQVEAAGRGIRCYELRYAQSPDSFRTLLDEVAVHGADGCTAPTPFVTSFAYRTNAAANPPRTGWGSSTSWPWPSGLPLVDENTLVGPQDKGVRLVDVDGDGRPDLLKAFAIMQPSDPQNPSFSADSGVYLNQGDGFSTTKSPTHLLPQGETPEGVLPVAFANTIAGEQRTAPTGLVALDMTGDGRADLAGMIRILGDDGSRTNLTFSSWFRGTGNAFDPVPVDGTEPMITPFWGTARLGWLQNPLTPAGVIAGNTRFADLNGDGLPELIVRGDEESYTFPGAVCTQFIRTSFHLWNLGDLSFQLAPTNVSAQGFGCLENFHVFSTSYQPCNTAQSQCSRQTSYGLTAAVKDGATSPWSWWIHHGYGNEDLDVNGDGLSDIVSRTDFPSGQVTPAVTWINNGVGGYGAGAGWAIPTPMYQFSATSEFSRDLGARFADVNGDGRPDLVRWRDGAKNVWLNDGDVEDGTAWEPTSAWLLPSGEVFVDSEGRDRGLRLVDIDGDGMVDVVRSEGSVSRVYLNRGEVPDLLEQVTTPIGGTIQYGYTPSTEFDHRGGDGIPDLPAVLQLVTSITMDGGPGGGPPITTTFSYLDGLFDAEDRELRGFRRVVATRGDRRTVTHFHQTAALAGLMATERVTSADDPDRCWSGTDHFYTPDASPPYVSLLTSQVRLEYDGLPCTGSPRRTRVSFVYGPGNQDPYGNVTQIIDYGEVNAQYEDTSPADNRITDLVYATPNTTAHLVDRVRSRSLSTGAAGQATLVNRTLLFYDDDATGAAAPALGRLTMRREVLNESGKPNPTTILAYDELGNLRSVRDPRHVAGQRGGAPTSYEYDTTFQTFRTAVVDPKGHRTEYAYSAPACAFDYPAGAGLVQNERGPNELAAGTRWLRCFDVHGRPVGEHGPLGMVETLWDYEDTPGAVSVTAHRRVQAGSYRSSTTFLDGLGRVVAEWTDGPQGRTVVASRQYDEAGRLADWSAPRLCTNPAVPGSCDAEQITSFAYDPLDRLQTETRPGNRITSYVRDRGWVTTTDANGNRNAVRRDAFGNVGLVFEYDGVQGQAETVSWTLYEYRADDQLKMVTDTRNNQTTIGYDLLGRRRTLADPDTGLTQYDYDANGNLLTQTDAAGQTLRWSYDELDRPDVRRIGGPSGPIESDWDYDTAPGGIGALARRSDGAGVYRRTAYDAVGRPTGERIDVADTSFEFTSAYDGLGQRTNRWYPTFPATKQIRWDYDARGYLTGTSGMVATNSAEWDAQGRLELPYSGGQFDQAAFIASSYSTGDR